MASSLILPRILKGFSLFAMGTGTLDTLIGTATVPGASDHLPVASPATALLDSQFRFMGSMWMGYGLMLWWASNDLQGRGTPLAILGGVMVAGGIGRAAAALKHGFGASWVRIAMVVELVAPALIYLLGF